MSLDPKVLEEFTVESKKIIINLMAILKQIQGQASLAVKLEDFGNQVDRIMGAAQSLALAMADDHALDLISDYSSICKSVAYKGAQMKDNPAFYDLCVAFLLDATKALEILIQGIHLPFETLKKSVDSTMIERFRWVFKQASDDPNAKGGLEDGKMSQTDVDDLIKKIGD